MIAMGTAVLSLVGTAALGFGCGWLHDWNALWIAPLLFVGWFLVLTVLLFAALLLIGACVDQKAPVTKEHPFFRKMMHWMSAYLDFFGGARLQVIGKEKVPSKQRVLFVANHRSMFDPIVTADAFRDRDISYVSKPGNFDIPIAGGFAHMCRFLSLDRDDPRAAVGVMRTAADIIASGDADVGIYPEGTRNKTNEPLLPMHNGSVKIAKIARCPIVVLTTRNTQYIAKNFPLRTTKVTITVVDVIDAETVNALHTEALTERMRNAMLIDLSD